MRGKTLGLVGLGRIGRAVATRPGLRLARLAYDPVPGDAEFEAKHGIRRLGFEELLAESDVVSLHLPLSEATQGLINRVPRRRCDRARS